MPTISNTNRMGTMPIGKLLFSMSTPIVISMLVMALYNIIDSIFVARISEDALTAVSLAYPIQMLMIAVSVGTGVGINALLSRSLGANEIEIAQKTADNAIFLGILGSLVFVLLGVCFSNLFFETQTTNPIIKAYGATYLSIVTIFSLPLFLEITFERILQATGKTIYNMVTQLVGAIINIILDPILIFGLCGVPKMGITGAAIATVIGQFFGMLLSIIFNILYNEEIKISFGFHRFRPDFSIIKSIYALAIPTIIMQSMATVMILFFNKILSQFSDTAISVLGIYFKLQSFAFMPVYGVNNGMTPIIAFNYGAKNKNRITDTIKLALLASLGIMGVCTAIFWIFTTHLLSLFDANTHMLSIGIPAIRYCALCFVFAGFNIVCIAVYQSLGNGLYALYSSFLRQLILVIPLACVLSMVGGLTLIWFAFPLAEIGNILLNIQLMQTLHKKKIAPL